MSMCLPDGQRRVDGHEFQAGPPCTRPRTSKGEELVFCEGGSHLPQPPSLLTCDFLPALGLQQLAVASRGLAACIQLWAAATLPARHRILAARLWPRERWLQVAAGLEEATFTERFSRAWCARWRPEGQACLADPSAVEEVLALRGARLAALATGPRPGETTYPGSGAECTMRRLRPARVSWLARATGIAAASDGRVGCVRLGERPGLEAVRMYFTGGNLWWEGDDCSPKALLPNGAFRDGRWYHIVCRLDWEDKTCGLTIEPLLGEEGHPEGGAAAEGIARHSRLAFHSLGCTHIEWLAVGSVAWASSPLSESTSHIAEIVFHGGTAAPEYQMHV